MMVAQASLTLVLAALCAGLMGYAIQRGATCTVAAVGEIVENRSAHRLVALAEAALWVAGGLLVGRQVGLVMHLPSGFAPSGWTLAGGALLGLGAWLNRACVFGAIARLGVVTSEPSPLAQTRSPPCRNLGCWRRRTGPCFAHVACRLFPAHIFN